MLMLTPMLTPTLTPMPMLLPMLTLTLTLRRCCATGLTGKALVLYVILSEGARVIPVRNALPVP